VAGLLGDLHVYDPANGFWMDLTESASGPRPVARYRHGVTNAGDMIYVFGGSLEGARRYIYNERVKEMHPKTKELDWKGTKRPMKKGRDTSS
jgi:hypothetical protein